MGREEFLRLKIRTKGLVWGRGAEKKASKILTKFELPKKGQIQSQGREFSGLSFGKTAGNACGKVKLKGWVGPNALSICNSIMEPAGRLHRG